MKLELEKFGISEGISEVIVTTASDLGEFNAAPIGIICERGTTSAKIYPDSHTYENINSNGMMVANITNDPELFVFSAFGDLGTDYYEKFHGYPVIRVAKAWILFSCEILQSEEQDHHKYFVISLDPISAKVNFNDLNAVSRSKNAVIESTVHATRYMVSRDKRLMEWVDYYDTIVSKCGGPGERRAMEMLYEFLGCQRKHDI